MGTARYRNRPHQTPRPPRETLGERCQSAGVLLVDPDRNPPQQHFGAVAVQTGGKVASRSIHYSPGIWILVPALVSHGGARRQDLVRESLCRHPALHIPTVVASLSCSGTIDPAGHLSLSMRPSPRSGRSVATRPVHPKADGFVQMVTRMPFSSAICR